MRLFSIVTLSVLPWVLGVAPATAADLAQPTVTSPVVVTAEPAQACPAEPLEITPAPFSATVTWPAPGQVCYFCETDPNCIWTCKSGVHGSANVGGSSACQQACRAQCGPSPTQCLMI